MIDSEGIWVGTDTCASEPKSCPILIQKIYEIFGGDAIVDSIYLTAYRKEVKEQVSSFPDDHKVAPLELTMWKDT